ncbi:MAG: terminase large subunit domain-containing protein [Rubinisphaera brasiliensis]|uniref:terminase large subunit domain-containing protein n=1 Tax=Rubinisphaera brasiliensis TaxID=119 RepID=UPI003918A42A
MKNSCGWRGWKKLRYRLNLKQTLRRRAATRDPRWFREALQLDQQQEKARQRWQAWQLADFAALDPAWRALANQAIEPPFQRAYLERPRGHSKTTDTAVQLLWILQNSPTRVEGLAAAADLEQGLLIRNAMQRISEANGDLCGQLVFRQQFVQNEATGSRLTVISSDVQSSWGALPDFVICDELSHWEKPDLWYSLISSAAKKPRCLVVVLTNAGVGRGWQFEVREAARKSDRWYFASLDGCQAPWITADWLEEQRQLLPAPVFDRLWNNRWQQSDGSFVSLAEAEACRDEGLIYQEEGRPGRRYFAAIDYAEKRDYTVGVVLHRDGTRLVVDRMDVVCPTADAPVPVQWVEDWMLAIARAFPGTQFVVDEYQLLSTIQKLEGRLRVKRFPFLGGQGNHALAMNLRTLILQRGIAWYAGCGQLPLSSARDDLESELASVLLRQSSGGRIRIDHVQDQVHHDDRVFALGAAALEAIQAEAGGEWLQVQPPAAEGMFGWME